MHEASILLYALQAVEDAAKANAITQVAEVRLAIGKQRGALPDALQFLFSVVKKRSIFADGSLIIEEVDIVVRCESCSSETPLESGAPNLCSACGGKNVTQIQGNELRIVSFKGR